MYLLLIPILGLVLGIGGAVGFTVGYRNKQTIVSPMIELGYVMTECDLTNGRTNKRIVFEKPVTQSAYSFDYYFSNINNYRQSICFIKDYRKGITDWSVSKTIRYVPDEDKFYNSHVLTEIPLKKDREEFHKVIMVSGYINGDELKAIDKVIKLLKKQEESGDFIEDALQRLPY
ncbi:MAG: hypothetical protein IJ889_00080 [Eubacterium sp.]|nr:hypothetical protein [Eubacterium sp.]MBR2247329.1 hypothetical protein [Bacilli bacterium]